MIDKRESDSEYWNARKAERQPMRQMTDGVRLLDDLSGKLAKRVLSNAAEAGLPKAEVEAMRQRMLAWLKTLKIYQVDMRETMRDEKIPMRDRCRLVAEMADNLDAIRVEVFGE